MELSRNTICLPMYVPYYATMLGNNHQAKFLICFNVVKIVRTHWSKGQTTLDFFEILYVLYQNQIQKNLWKNESGNMPNHFCFVFCSLVFRKEEHFESKNNLSIIWITTIPSYGTVPYSSMYRYGMKKSDKNKIE